MSRAAAGKRATWLVVTAGIAVALVGGPVSASAKAPRPSTEPPSATVAGICDANLWLPVGTALRT